MPTDRLEDELSMVPAMYPGSQTFSSQSYSQFDFSDDLGAHRPSLGAPQGSYLTIPSSHDSTRTSSYAASDVCSDQDYEPFPQFGYSSIEPASPTRHSTDFSFTSNALELYQGSHWGSNQTTGFRDPPESQSFEDMISQSYTGGSFQQSSNIHGTFPPHFNPAAPIDASIEDADLFDSPDHGMSTAVTTQPLLMIPDRSRRTRSQRPRSSSASVLSQPANATGIPIATRRTSMRERRQHNLASRLFTASPAAQEITAGESGISRAHPPSQRRVRSPARRGRRRGHMTEEGRAEATEKRKKCMICLHCKIRKVKVSVQN